MGYSTAGLSTGLPEYNSKGSDEGRRRTWLRIDPTKNRFRPNERANTRHKARLGLRPRRWGRTVLVPLWKSHYEHHKEELRGVSDA